MYRSLGEFTRHATTVFDYFARLEASQPADSLDQLLCREAFFVLFGYKPTASLLATLFSESTNSADGRCSADARRVDRESFTDFAQIVARREGCILCDDGKLDEGGTGVLRTGDAHLGHSWVVFEALAGGKDYIDWDDFHAGGASLLTDDSTPDDGNRASEECAAVVTFDGETGRLWKTLPTQQRVLSHVFALLDTDHDGRLRFADVQRYLEYHY